MVINRKCKLVVIALNLQPPSSSQSDIEQYGLCKGNNSTKQSRASMLYRLNLVSVQNVILFSFEIRHPSFIFDSLKRNN